MSRYVLRLARTRFGLASTSVHEKPGGKQARFDLPSAGLKAPDNYFKYNNPEYEAPPVV